MHHRSICSLVPNNVNHVAALEHTRIADGQYATVNLVRWWTGFSISSTNAMA